MPPTATDFQADIRQGKFDVAWGNHGAFGVDDPFNTIDRGGWVSTSTEFLGGWQPNKDVDRLYAEQDRALDPSKRRQLLYEVQRATLGYRIRMIATAPVSPTGHWPEVKDRPLPTTVTSNSWRLERVWLDR